MYQAPDFVKISVNVKDVYAAYNNTGCPPDDSGAWLYVAPCEGKGDAIQIGLMTVAFAENPHQCYSSFNP